MRNFLLYLWQLPQNLLGLVLKVFYGDCKEYSRMNGRIFYYTRKMPSGISLGKYIIMSVPDISNGMKHEYGHSIQSKYLGPLYLIIIGLPSLLGNIYDRVFHKNWEWEKSYKWYYNQPWEKWADKLGGVER